jgi:hypothetical protein
VSPELPALAPDRTELEKDAWRTATDLARLFGVEGDALRQRLNRWRKKNDGGWKEVTDRKPREPKYLYRDGAVRSIVGSLKTSSEPSSEQPAKKNRAKKQA